MLYCIILERVKVVSGIGEIKSAGRSIFCEEICFDPNGRYKKDAYERRRFMSEIHREERIISHPVPFDGQEHRSSGNFSTRYIQDSQGKKPESLLWEIIADKQDDASNISFQVYGDDPRGIDDDIFGGKRIKSGNRTKFIDERMVYIHSPQGAKKPFTVRVTGMDTKLE